MKLPGTYMFIWPILKYVKKIKNDENSNIS